MCQRMEVGEGEGEAKEKKKYTSKQTRIKYVRASSPNQMQDVAIICGPQPRGAAFCAFLVLSLHNERSFKVPLVLTANAFPIRTCWHRACHSSFGSILCCNPPLHRIFTRHRSPGPLKIHEVAFPSPFAWTYKKVLIASLLIICQYDAKCESLLIRLSSLSGVSSSIARDVSIQLGSQE